MRNLTRFFAISCAIAIYAVDVLCGGFEEEWGVVFKNYARNDDRALTPRCRFRDHASLYPPDEIWRFVVGAYCYSYAVHARLNYDFGLSHAPLRNFSVPYVAFNETTPIVFDYESEEAVQLIRGLFRTERFFDLWEECARLGVECCENHLNETNVIPSETYVCPALWDAWDCWPQARAGETQRRICPEHSYTSEDIVCEIQSEKYCLETDWNHTTNYLSCSNAPTLRRRHNYHALVLTISAALTFPAIIIFFVFMTNQKDLRHVLNRNLLIAIVLKNIFTITSKHVIILDVLEGSITTNGVMVGNGVGCRMLSSFDTVATVGVFTCMLLVGYYLHSTIARVFGKQLNLTTTYAVTVVCTLIPSLAWAITMGATGQVDCWIVDTYGYHWITDVYKFSVLVINVVLLLDIIRVICVQRSGLNAKQTRAAAKAIVVLVPLFGIPLLLLSQRDVVDQNNCLAGDIYYFVTYTVEALQGIVVALLFCYMNKEVHAEIKKRYRKWIVSINSRYGTNFNVPTQARVTTLTNVRTSTLDQGRSGLDKANRSSSDKRQKFPAKK